MSKISHDFVPSDENELRLCLDDPMWRVCSGYLYKIMIKDDGLAEGNKVVPFRPNRFQKRLIRRLWFRTLILKARQLGFTTLISILWLDHALFNADQRCGIVAHDKSAAISIFRDKVKFAYTNLPEQLRKLMPLQKNAADELLFAHNNSSVRVATSMRSGTLDRLLISEFGKICAKFPDKAEEVLTGSLPSVPQAGIAIIESTAEGQGGAFHDMSVKSQARAQMKDRPLNHREWRFNFFSWWENPEYEMDPAGVIITAKEHEYFDTIEAKVGADLSLRKRAWYISTRDSDFAGDAQRMERLWLSHVVARSRQLRRQDYDLPRQSRVLPAPDEWRRPSGRDRQCRAGDRSSDRAFQQGRGRHTDPDRGSRDERDNQALQHHRR